MRGKMKSMTFEQARKIKSLTDWKKVRREEPDMTDPDAPDFSGLLEKEIEHRRLGRPKKEVCKKSLTLRVEPFTLIALRQYGKGWQTRLSNYISEGVRKGLV